jgi:hypothetical protein
VALKGRSINRQDFAEDADDEVIIWLGHDLL